MKPTYILIALQVIDAITTIIFLSSGAAKEGNKLLAKLFAKIGVLPGLLLVKGGFAAFIWYYQDLIHPYAVFAMIAVYLYVIANNLYFITKD